MVLFDEAATWTGVGALAISALLLGLGILLFTRWRGAAAGEIADIRATGERTESLLTELRRALGDAQNEGRRLAALGHVGTTLDLDAALERAHRRPGWAGVAPAPAPDTALLGSGSEAWRAPRERAPA